MAVTEHFLEFTAFRSHTKFWHNCNQQQQLYSIMLACIVSFTSAFTLSSDIWGSVHWLRHCQIMSFITLSQQLNILGQHSIDMVNKGPQWQAKFHHYLFFYCTRHCSSDFSYCLLLLPRRICDISQAICSRPFLTNPLMQELTGSLRFPDTQMISFETLGISVFSIYQGFYFIKSSMSIDILFESKLYYNLYISLEHNVGFCL